MVENDHARRRLALLLAEAAGFTFAVATYDTPTTRAAQLTQLAADLTDSPVALTTLDLSSSPDERFLLDGLRSHLAGVTIPVGKRPAVMVVGLESALDYRTLTPTPHDGLAILANANVQRDAFAELVPVPVVLWLNPTATATLANHAPDLWDWRAATFEFAGPPAARAEMAQAFLHTPLAVSNSASLPDKRERLTVFRDLLVELGVSAEGNPAEWTTRKAALLIEISRTHRKLGNISEAIEFARDAVTEANRGSSTDLQINAANALGTALVSAHRPREAVEVFDQAARLAATAGLRRTEAGITINMGVSTRDLGDKTRARELFEKAARILRELGSRYDELVSLGNLGRLALDEDNFEQAIRDYERAIRLAEEIGDQESEATCLAALGVAYSRVGDQVSAVRLLDRSLGLQRRLGDRCGEAMVLWNLLHVYARLGNRPRVQECGDAALALFDATEFPGHERYRQAVAAIKAYWAGEPVTPGLVQSAS